MFDAAVNAISTLIELAGIATMVIGFVLSGILAISDARTYRPSDIYRAARHRVGKAILLGLELLVAADILRTVTELPSLAQVAVLAAIVGIRTFLSFTLEIELTGELPWRRADRDAEATHDGGEQRHVRAPAERPSSHAPLRH